ncbi:MAG: HlyD family efflux transporter periplasmic adaptor subunit [Betaproteobacteria bacterium]|nr:HlyD family efflux transporter periplasmic adaptor subunit [Betaproteobacteria bacterium]
MKQFDTAGIPWNGSGAAILAGALALAACGEREPSYYQGYVEAEYVRVAVPFSGRLERLHVERGAQVKAGDPLFALERENETAARREAEERLKNAEAQLANLRKGRRPTELDAIRAQLAQAESSLKLSEAQLKRAQQLVAQNFIAKEKLDEARAARDRDSARIAQFNADLATARLAARADEIKAAQAAVAAAQATFAQAEWRLAQKSATAPVGGLVADTLYVKGEWVQAGSPVVSLLPPRNLKVRFFVPEPALGTLRVGQDVSVACDGCAEPIRARLTFIAPQAEFTPPVIYSKENRAKLVFLIEVRPSPEDAVKLHPGQPVEVRVTP